MKKEYPTTPNSSTTNPFLLDTPNEVAEACKDQRIVTIPCAKGEKHPRLKGWNNIIEHDPEHWKHPQAGLCVHLGPSSIIDLDIDKDSAKLFVETYPERKETFIFGHGERLKTHHFYRGEINKKEYKYDGDMYIELRSGGGSVTMAPPSIHPDGSKYEAHNDIEIAEAPKGLEMMARYCAAGALLADNWPAQGHAARLALAGMLAQAGESQRMARWLLEGICVSVGHGKEDGRDAIHSTYDRVNQNKRVKTDLEDAGVPEKVVKTVSEWLGIRGQGHFVALDGGDGEKPKTWRDDLITSPSTGAVSKTFYNVCTVLKNTEDFSLRFNELSQETLVGIDGAKEESMTDKVVNNVRHRIAQKEGWAFSANDTRDALQHVGQQNSFDPIHDYLNALPSYDPEKDEDHIAKAGETLGLEKIETICLQKWMVSAIARALEPGCKADCMIVLSGPQGIGKTSFAELLAVEPDWFQDRLSSFDTKEPSQEIAGAWIVEVSELDAMKSSRLEAAKAFISRQFDKFRPSYQAMVVQLPRRCVFVGTTNKQAYLSDPTGNRRFWPIQIRQPINRQWVKEVRDNLWSQALYLYRKGESWYETAAMSKRLSLARERSSIITTIEDQIVEHLDRIEAGSGPECEPASVLGQPWTCARQMFDLLEIDTVHQTRAFQHTVRETLEKYWVQNPGARMRVKWSHEGLLGPREEDCRVFTYSPRN